MSDTIEKTALRDGDIYRWRWSDPERDRNSGSYGSYHCKSRIAVVRNGHLYDTFWYGNGSDGWLDPKDVTLTFWANKADLQEIKHYDVGYYRSSDVVDLRHSNNSHGPIYLRIGAKRDAETMADAVRQKIEDHQSNIRFSERDIARLREAEALIAAGDLDAVYL